MTTLSDLKGNTQYTVTVSAVNGAGEGASTQITVRTMLGVFPPVISVVLTEEANSVYTLRINGFSTDYGALRYMYMYNTVWVSHDACTSCTVWTVAVT